MSYVQVVGVSEPFCHHPDQPVAQVGGHDPLPQQEGHLPQQNTSLSTQGCTSCEKLYSIHI